MMPLEHSGLAATVLEAALKCHFPTILASTVSEAGRGGKAPCQYIKYARSGRAADAVRGHAFSSAPTRSGAVSLERLSPPFFVRLTPARWEAIRLASQFSGRVGSGAVVPAGTAQNQRQNRQITDIAEFFSLVPRFQRLASRHVCACVRVGTCAYMRARKARTSEPSYIIHVNQMDRGSGAGSGRFCSEPPAIEAGAIDAFAPVSNKIVGRYAPIGADRARRGLAWSRAGETFGDFRSAGWSIGVRCSSSTRGSANGGFPPFLARRSGVVGTLPLERMAESLGNARFSGFAHLPSGKAARIALGGRGTPPCPHSETRHLPAPSRARVAEFRSAFGLTIIPAFGTAWKNRREDDFRERGRGKLRPGRNPANVPGRGGGDAAGKLRRMPCMGGGDNHVK